MVVTVVALVLTGAGKLAAGERYRLETSVYVFKDSDFESLKLPVAKETGDHGAVVVHAPATIAFDHESLSLHDAGFSWSGGRNPPERFTLVKTPDIMIGPGKPVEMLSTAPVQYIEKAADGTLQVRDIGADSADAPHCRIRFAVASPDEASADLRVSCNLDIATVSAREDVPGLSLDVGRPLLARFQDRVEVGVRTGEPAALLIRKPNGSDYSLLLLLNTMPAEGSESRATRDDRRMTAEEFAQFATYYYRQPQPELIAGAIESLGPSGFLDSGGKQYSYWYNQRGYTCVGFFAEVFAANPARTTEWRKLIDRRGQDGDIRFWLRKALKLCRPGALLELGPKSPDSVGLTDIYWGAFFASGNPAYLRKLIDRLRLVNDGDRSVFYAGADAMVSLAYNAPHHPLVRQTLEAARKDADPRTRKLIDDLLQEDVATVRQEIREVERTLHGRETPSSGDRHDWGLPVPPPPPPGPGH